MTVHNGHNTTRHICSYSYAEADTYKAYTSKLLHKCASY